MTETNEDKQLSRMVLKGFKSIEWCEIELSRVNVLIGANGAGKSNFIGFFRMIQQLLAYNLQVFVSRQGGPDALLYFGRKTTEQLEFQLYFGNNGYFATLEPTEDNRLMFAKESFWWNVSGEREIGRGHFEHQALRLQHQEFPVHLNFPVSRVWQNECSSPASAKRDGRHYRHRAPRATHVR